MLPAHTSTRHASRRAGWLAAALTSCAVLPVTLTARPAESTADRFATTRVSPVLAGAPRTSQSAAAPASLEDLVVPSAAGASGSPAVATAGASAQRSTRPDDEPWVLFKAGERGVTSGSSEGRAAAERHRVGTEGMLWFRRGGKEYVVRDPALLRRAESAFAPLETIGGRMGEIGAKQGALGARQGEWGAKQGTLGGRQGALAAQQAALGLRQASVQLKRSSKQSSQEERTMLDKEAAAIEAEMQKLAREMEALGREMEEIARPMNDLGRQMEVHGTELEALGQQMEAAAAEAEAELDALKEEAIRTGRAEEVR